MDEATAKALQDQVKALQEKFDSQTAELTKARQQLTESSQYIDDTSILVSAIMKDPALKTQVAAAVQGQSPTPPPTESQPDKSNWKFDPQTGKPINEPTPPAPDPRINSLDEKSRLEAINKVENKFKITDEQRKDIRKSVGSWLAGYGMAVDKIPVNELEQKLSDAYLHVGLEQASKDGKELDVVQSFREDPGKLPAMGSGSPDHTGAQLSPDHKKWAGKLNVPEDKVAAGLKELTEKGTITYKPKDETTKQNQPSPSGQPTPPPVSV